LFSDNKYLKNFRLLKKNDFLHLRTGSRFLLSNYLIFYHKTNQGAETRIGISANKKFGNAIKRNRVKRLIRENFRTSDYKCLGKDILIVINNKKIKKDNLNSNDFERKVIGDLMNGFLKISKS